LKSTANFHLAVLIFSAGDSDLARRNGVCPLVVLGH